MKIQNIPKEDLEKMEAIRVEFRGHSSPIREIDFASSITANYPTDVKKRMVFYLAALGFIDREIVQGFGMVYLLTPKGMFPLTLNEFLEQEKEADRVETRMREDQEKTNRYSRYGVILSIFLAIIALVVSALTASCT